MFELRVSSSSFRVGVREWKDNVGRADTPWPPHLVHKSSQIFTNGYVALCADLWIEFFSWSFEFEFESRKVMLVGRRIVIVFSRVEVEKWRMAEYRFLTGFTGLTGLG